MLDPFTIAAQIINFLILVFLLAKFLYKPVTRAMDKRQALVVAQLDEGRNLAAEATRQLEQLKQDRQQAVAERAELFARAQQEVEAQRQELVTGLRRDIGAMQEEWIKTLQNERAAFLAELKLRAAEQICEASRRALMDLSDAQLEERVAAKFVDKLHTLDPEDKASVLESLQTHGPELVVRSTFELSQPLTNKIREAIVRNIDSGSEISFEMAPGMICGVELNAHGRKIAWNVDSYMDGLEDNIAEVFSAMDRREIKGSGSD